MERSHKVGSSTAEMPTKTTALRGQLRIWIVVWNVVCFRTREQKYPGYGDGDGEAKISSEYLGVRVQKYGFKQLVPPRGVGKRRRGYVEGGREIGFSLLKLFFFRLPAQILTFAGNFFSHLPYQKRAKMYQYIAGDSFLFLKKNPVRTNGFLHQNGLMISFTVAAAKKT